MRFYSQQQLLWAGQLRALEREWAGAAPVPRSAAEHSSKSEFSLTAGDRDTGDPRIFMRAVASGGYAEGIAGATGSWSPGVRTSPSFVLLSSSQACPPLGREGSSGRWASFEPAPTEAVHGGNVETNVWSLTC